MYPLFYASPPTARYAPLGAFIDSSRFSNLLFVSHICETRYMIKQRQKSLPDTNLSSIKSKIFLFNTKLKDYSLIKISNFIEKPPFAWSFFVSIWFSFLKIEPIFLSLKFRYKVFNAKNKNFAKNYNVCHIFGNGMSVMKSHRKVSRDDFVIKINTGILIPVHTNIWMTELHDKNDFQTTQELEKNIELFSKLKRIVKEDNPDVTLLLKNVWFNNVSPKIYDKNSEFFILQDFGLRPTPRDEKFLRFTIKSLIFDNGNIVGQMHTSILTALILSYKLGFKKIIIHGLDGFGSHFFHNHYFDHVDDDFRSDVIIQLRHAFPIKSDVYVSGSNGKSVIGYYIEALDNVGVKVKFAHDINLP